MWGAFILVVEDRGLRLFSFYDPGNSVENCVEKLIPAVFSVIGEDGPLFISIGGNEAGVVLVICSASL